jgi:hypothetical protein
MTGIHRSTLVATGLASARITLSVDRVRLARMIYVTFATDTSLATLGAAARERVKQFDFLLRKSRPCGSISTGTLSMIIERA